MKMKTIIAVAALACASVASAATNYVEQLAKRHDPIGVVHTMSSDPALADSAAFRAALEAVDRAGSTGKVVTAYWCVSRRCPLTARAVLGRCEAFSPKAREDMLALCRYDAENCGVLPRPGEDGYANCRLQAACAGMHSAANVRSDILKSAIAPARRYVRANGDSFVGKEGAKLVKGVLDDLAAELNAPRFGKAGEILMCLGIEVEWEFVQSRILGDREIAEIKAKLMDGEIAFTGTLQNKLCIALGVEGYNAFVKEYNGPDRCRKQV